MHAYHMCCQEIRSRIWDQSGSTLFWFGLMYINVVPVLPTVLSLSISISISLSFLSPSFRTMHIHQFNLLRTTLALLNLLLRIVLSREVAALSLLL